MMGALRHMKMWQATVASAMAMLVAGCDVEPPLHLPTTFPVHVNVIYHEIDLNVMWQVNWRADWQFDWNETAWGPLGYTVPSGVRMHLYTLGDNDEVKYYNKYNFAGMSGEVPIKVGVHNMLFHNNDTEYIIYNSDSELSPISVTTRVIARGLQPAKPVQAVSSRTDSQLAEVTIDEKVVNAPDQLFTLYHTKYVVTDDYRDYQLIDGKYVAVLNGEITPATFIYLAQVKLKNNNGRVVGCDNGAAITGMSNTVMLNTGMTGEDAVSVKFEMRFQASDGTRPDMLGGRVMTFGMCGIEPYDKSTIPDTPKKKNYLVLNITYRNGSSQNIQVDVTDQVAKLPTGGVITVELDVDDFPMPDAGKSGGFAADIADWDDTEAGYTID